MAPSAVNGSSTAVSDTPKSSKNKKKNAKKKAKAAAANGTPATNGPEPALDRENAERSDDEDGEDEVEPSTPVGEESIPQEKAPEVETTSTQSNGPPVEAEPPIASKPSHSRKPTIEGIQKLSLEPNDDTSKRLDELIQERELLRNEVSTIRASLEKVQADHLEELRKVKDQLSASETETETAKKSYNDLRQRVKTLQEQLGDKLKSDAAEIERQQGQIEELEAENAALKDQATTREAELSKTANDGASQSKELSSLRQRLVLAQQNWAKEKDDLESRELYAREEFESAKQAMQDWEVLAIEERRAKESLAERLSELEEQSASYKETYESAASERDKHAIAIQGLKKALDELQQTRKTELRENVEAAHAKEQALTKERDEALEKAATTAAELSKGQAELERVLPFEKEVRDKGILIGKLKHEAVILNDTLNKALRQITRGKQDDVIDRQLMTNLLLQFLAIDRADPKKFQVLQIIASSLNWTDEQREGAGLARPGASNPNLRAPISPYARTPSTPSLSVVWEGERMTSPSSTGKKESLGDKWTDFLESEVEKASSKGGSE